MKRKYRCGFSLIEVAVSILILAVLAMGGAAIFYQTGGNIQRQQNKREAIVVANTALESYWNKTFEFLGSVANSTFSQTVLINGQSRTVTIAISEEKDDGDGGDYYEIHVTVPWMAGETVDLVSRRYEFGLSKAVSGP